MNARLFWTTIPPTLHWLAFFALAALVGKVFWLNSLTEPIQGMYQLGLVFEGVLASVLASYVFYLIVIHTKELRDRNAIYPNVLRWARNVVGDCQSQLSEFSKHAAMPIELQTLKKEDVEAMFKKIDPYSNAPLVFSQNNYANWIQYFEYHKVRSKRFIAQIMAQLFFLEAPLVSHLSKIDDSSHFHIVEMLGNHRMSNKDLSAFASTFYNYCVACRDLDAFLTEHPLAHT